MRQQYSTNDSDSDASNVLFDKLWYIVIGLFLTSILCFSLFILQINKDYRWTFIDTRTGKTFAVETFEEAETDASKFEIFGHHPSFYFKIKNELMKWLEDSWEKWEDEKPEWFTAQAISQIPADMLPETGWRN